MAVPNHHLALALGYGAAGLAWLLLSRTFPSWWPAPASPRFARPWREVGWALLATLAVVGIGQLYGAGIRLPRLDPIGPLLEAFNQALIFSPMVLPLVWRRHPPSSAWLAVDRVALRLTAGAVLSAIAVVAFAAVRAGADEPWSIWPRLLRPGNVHLAVQVFLEDFSVAVLVVRLSQALPREWMAAVLVGSLFAAGHLPTLLGEERSIQEAAFLVLDGLLAGEVIGIAMRSRDLWWLFCVHYAMDMMQFAVVSRVAMAS